MAKHSMPLTRGNIRQFFNYFHKILHKTPVENRAISQR